MPLGTALKIPQWCVTQCLAQFRGTSPSVFSQRESSSFSLWLLLPLVQEFGFILATLGDGPVSSQDGDSQCVSLPPAGQALTCLPVAGTGASQGLETGTCWAGPGWLLPWPRLDQVRARREDLWEWL